MQEIWGDEGEIVGLFSIYLFIASVYACVHVRKKEAEGTFLTLGAHRGPPR